MAKLDVKSLNEVPVADLRERGIRGAILDVDNTLCRYHGTSVDARVEEGYRRIINSFNSCILSNTDLDRMRQLEKYFRIHAILTRARKPLPEAFTQATEYLNCKPGEVVMIGDRLLSDIAGANMAGLYTIRVQPLQRSSEPFKHTIARAFENSVYRTYKLVRKINIFKY